MIFFVQGFLHGSMKIGECSLKQWLPINHIAELVAIKFEVVHPGNGQLDPRYREHYAIKKFLDDTSLEPSVDGKPLRFDFQGSSAEPEGPHYERAGTWFLHARVRLRDDRNFSDLLADRLPRQEASLKAASLITYACEDVSGEGSEHPGTLQVQILLHGKSGRGIRRGTVEAWLPLGDEIEDLVIEPIHGNDEVRMREADDDIENRTPNPVHDAGSQTSVGSRSTSARRASATGSRSSDQTLRL